MKEHKYYKEKISVLGMGKGRFTDNKRGQIAIFVIIAIVIVAVILVLLLRPKLGIGVTATFTPEQYLRECIQDDIKINSDLLASQGGYYNPEGFVVYNSTKVKYLCYNSQYYKTCMIQQPKLREHFENELIALIKPKLELCALNLKEEYERRGFDVTKGESTFRINIVPDNINVIVDMPLTLRKDEESESFRGFDIKVRSEMYDLIMTSVSIIDYEATYGDSETNLYLQYYPNLRIDKMKLSDGTTIYKVSDVVSEESFTFASRSLAWPPGYGLDE